MNRRSFLLRGALAAAAVGAGFWIKDHLVWGRPQLRFTGEGLWHDLLETAAPVPIVEVVIAGRKTRALIDSGAQFSVLDRTFGEALPSSAFDMPVVAHGVGGQANVGTALTLSAELPDVSIEKLKVALLDLGPLARNSDVGVSMIIGRDLMREMVVEIDWQIKKVRFVDPAKWTAPRNLFPAKVEMSGDALAAVVRVEGRELTSIVDTGSSSLLSITEDNAERLGLNDGREERTGTSVVLGGMMQARWVKVSSIAYDSMEWRNADVAIYPASKLPNYPDALLGMNVFKGKKLALNLGQGQLFVSRPLILSIG